MIGKVAKIPFSDIEKVEIYINSKKQTMDQIKKSIGCDYIINAGLFDMNTFKPVNYLTVNNKVLSVGGNPYGYAFNKSSVVFSYNNNCKYPNFIGSYPCLLINGKVESFNTPSGLGGDRGRSAVGMTKDSFVLRCIPDVSGTSDYTLNELANDMKSLGCLNAINLDGGGSSQCDFKGQKITSSRKVHNFICVWLKDNKTTTPTTPPQNPTTPTTNTKTMYRVQVGSYGVRANAEKMLSNLKAKGYSGMIMPVTVNGKKMYRVQVGSFSVKSNAEKLLKELKSKGYSALIMVV